MFEGFFTKWQHLRKTDEGGQIITFFILVLIIILLFAMMTINIGQIALLKTRTANAADYAALSAASSVGSVAHFYYRNVMGSENPNCETDAWFWFDVVLFVVGVLTLNPLLIILSVASFVINQLVLEPDMFDDIQRQLKKLPQHMKFKESTNIAALSMLVRDGVRVVDIHDWDADTRDGFNGTTDTMPRFSFWLSQRLMALNILENEMKDAIKEIIFGLREILGTYVGIYDPVNDDYDIVWEPGPLPELNEKLNPEDSDSWAHEDTPKSLFAEIEDIDAPAYGLDHPDLTFWTPGIKNDKVDYLYRSMGEFYTWAQSLIKLTKSCSKKYGCDDSKVAKAGFLITTMDGWLPALYNDVSSIEWWDIIVGAPSRAEWDSIDYDNIYPWVPGGEDWNWISILTDMSTELQNIYDQLPEDCPTCTPCGPPPCDPMAPPSDPCWKAYNKCLRLWNECQAQLGECGPLVALRQRIDDEEVLDKINALLDALNANFAISFGGITGRIGEAIKDIQDLESEYQVNFDTIYYLWTEEKNGKTLWYCVSVKVEVPRGSDEMPWVHTYTEDSGSQHCAALVNATGYITAEVAYYGPDIPVWYVRGNESDSLLWRFRYRNKLDESVDDMFENEQITDTNGDSIITFEDLTPDKKADLKALMNEFAIKSYSKAKWGYEKMIYMIDTIAITEAR